MRAFVAVGVTACGSRHPASEPPACARVGDHVHALVHTDEERAAELREVFAARCEQDAWPADARRCVLAMTSLGDPGGCKAKLSAVQRAALDGALAELAARDRSRPPVECRDYERLVARLATCPQLSQAARETLQRAFDHAKSLWTAQAARPGLAETCQAGADGTRAAVAQICGW